MFSLFKKKQKEYNYWLQQEIELCEKYNYDLKKYITYETHPLHAKQIKIALFDELPEEVILKISRQKYINELELIKFRENCYTEIELEYFLNKYKPKQINLAIKNNKIDTLKGIILGDIIGSKYEFSEHEPISELFHRYSHFTDDTVMSIAIKCAIEENKEEPDFAKWFRIYYKKYPRAGYGSGFTNWCLDEKRKAYGSWANGSAMRVGYISAIYDNVEDVIKHAFNSSIVTHNHLEGIKGAIVTAVCIWMCKCGYSKEEIKEYFYSHYAYTKEQLENKTYGYLHYNLLDLESNNYKNDAGISCPFAVPYAIHCFLESDSLENCYFKVLEHFCDADTVCAIAGGIAGIYYGIDSKYDDIIENKLSKELFEKIKEQN